MAAVTIAATYEPPAGSIPPRIRLVATDTGSPVLPSTTVTRLDPDGFIRPVRTADGQPLVLTGATGTVYDYEMQYGAQVWYSSLESPSNSVQIVATESRIWLVHPGVPTLSLPIRVQEWGERNRKSAQGIFYPMGRDTPVVHTDAQRKAADYTLRVLTLTEAEYDALSDILEDASALHLNVPAGMRPGQGAEYVSVGDVVAAPVSRITSHPYRSWTLPIVVVSRPAGGSQATRTYTDVLIDFSSYNDVKANYNNYLAVLAGP